MKIQQLQFTKHSGWEPNLNTSLKPELVLAFGSRTLLEDPSHFSYLKSLYSSANIISCSTSGEIYNTSVLDDSISVVAIEFEKTTIQCRSIKVQSTKDSYDAGVTLISELPIENLKHVFVLSDGHIINGTMLVKGLESKLPKDVVITGGLAGDADKFEKTLVGLNEPASEGIVSIVGFYGDHIQIGVGCHGGWDLFGPEREITKSTDNVLYELDNQSALDLYKKYLGAQADSLPGSALLFPLAIKEQNDNRTPIMRTILSIDEDKKSMTFAGNMPQGATAQLMKANFDRLIDGAGKAAESSLVPLKNSKPELAILISCVGRKLILNQRTEEEVESVAETLSGNTVITGFYSYGEIAPFFGEVKCELHNQTMTITTMSEN